MLHVYRKPKDKVNKVFVGKEVEGMIGKALERIFLGEGNRVKPSVVKKFLRNITKPVGGGDVVLVLEQLPLHCMQVRGKVGDTVYQVNPRTGNQYSRGFTKARNPKTAGQKKYRGKFAGAVAAWKALSESKKEKYNQRARKMHRRGRNLFISSYLKPQ